MNQAAISYGCLAVSVFVHGVAVLGTSASPAAPPRRPLLTELQLSPLSAPVEPPPPPAPQPPAEPVTPARPAPAKPQAKRALPELPLPSEPEPPGAPPPPELTGRTLTTTTDTSWSAPAGNGAERDATLGVGAAAPRPSPVLTAEPAGTPPPTPVTWPLAKLSRKPAPPSLAAALERNFPSDARRQGKSGEAKVRALIDARGRATRVTVAFESGAGFGAACQKTLLQSQWSPPLDPHGEPTGTFVTYRCRFQIHD